MYVCPHCGYMNRPLTYQCDCIGGISFCRCKNCRQRFLPPELPNDGWGRTLPVWIHVTPTCVHTSRDKEKPIIMVPGVDNIPRRVKIKTSENGFDYQEYMHDKYKEYPMGRREFLKG